MNNFTFTISAVDNVTKNIKRINDNIDEMLKPIRRIQNSVKSMTKEAGLDRFGKSMNEVASRAGKVADNIRSITAPLAAVIGVGTVAGIADLATQWGKLGNNLTQISSVVGISTNDLQELQGAAKMAGLSSDAMTSSLKSLGDTMNDAVNGRNQDALMVMNKIGLTLHRTKSGAVDTARAMRDLADAVSSPKFKGNVQAQAELARIFNVEPMLFLLQKGKRGIEEYIEEARKLGYIMSPQQIAAADQYNRNMMAFEMTLSSLRNTIGNELIPTLKPLLDDLTKWVSAHKAVIATNIDAFVRRISEAIKNTNWDQWKMGLIGIAALLGSGLAANVLMLGWAIVKFTTSLGSLIKLAGGIGMTGALTNIAALGAKATLWGAVGYGGWEIGSFLGKNVFNPALNWLVEKATGEKGETLGGWLYDYSHPKNGSYTNGGLAYNLPKLNAYANSMEQKYGLPKNLLNGIKNYGERSNSNAVSPAGAVGVMQFMPGTWSKYGKGDPTDPYASIDAAGRYMHDLMQRYHGNTNAALAEYNGGVRQAELVISGKRPSASETDAYLQRVQSGMNAMNGTVQPQQMKVEVTFKNAPPGTRATAKNEKGHDMPVRVAQSMSYSMP